MKVEQFYNRNQFHLYSEKDLIDILQSYNSTVVKIETNLINHDCKTTITLGIDWDYSTTTSKYVYMFLEEYGNINFNNIGNKRAYINKLIKDGVIVYDENMR